MVEEYPPNNDRQTGSNRRIFTPEHDIRDLESLDRVYVCFEAIGSSLDPFCQSFIFDPKPRLDPKKSLFCLPGEGGTQKNNDRQTGSNRRIFTPEHDIRVLGSLNRVYMCFEAIWSTLDPFCQSFIFDPHPRFDPKKSLFCLSGERGTPQTMTDKRGQIVEFSLRNTIFGI